MNKVMIKSIMGAIVGNGIKEMTEREEEVCDMLDTKFQKTMFSIAANYISKDSNKEELEEVWETLNFSAQLGGINGFSPFLDSDYEKISKIIKEISNLLTDETDYVFQCGYHKENGMVFPFPILTKEEFIKQQEAFKRLSEEDNEKLPENSENNGYVALNPQFEVFGMYNNCTETESCKKKIKSKN